MERLEFPIRGKIFVVGDSNLASEAVYKMERTANEGKHRVHLFMDTMDPEHLAQMFHETYERLAPDHGYKTREASAKPWEEVPEQNKNLMIAVAKEILTQLRS